MVLLNVNCNIFQPNPARGPSQIPEANDFVVSPFIMRFFLNRLRDPWRDIICHYFDPSSTANSWIAYVIVLSAVLQFHLNDQNYPGSMPYRQNPFNSK